MTTLSTYQQHADLGKKKSQFVIDVSSGLTQLSKGVRKSTTTIVSSLFFGVLSVLGYPFLWLFIWFLTKKINQATALLDELLVQMKKEHEEISVALGNDKTLPDLYPELTSRDYTFLKRDQAVLLGLEKLLFDLVGTSEKQGDEPKLIKSLLIATERFYVSFKETNQKFSDLVKLYDVNTPEGNHFDTATEAELWNSRNEAYNYLV
jgi:hypothetical protein